MTDAEVSTNGFASRFHSLLQALCEEHEREVKELRGLAGFGKQVNGDDEHVNRLQEEMDASQVPSRREEKTTEKKFLRKKKKKQLAAGSKDRKLRSSNAVKAAGDLEEDHASQSDGSLSASGEQTQPRPELIGNVLSILNDKSAGEEEKGDLQEQMQLSRQQHLSNTDLGREDSRRLSKKSDGVNVPPVVAKSQARLATANSRDQVMARLSQTKAKKAVIKFVQKVPNLRNQLKTALRKEGIKWAWCMVIDKDRRRLDEQEEKFWDPDRFEWDAISADIFPVTVQTIKKRKRADDYHLADARKAAEAAESAFQRLVFSPQYEYGHLAVILVNAVFLGVQTQYVASETLEGRGVGAGQGAGWTILNCLFCLIFTTDVAIRWWLDGLVDFLRNEDYEPDGWNIFDIAIVVGANIELIIDFSGSKEALQVNIAFVRVLRLIRIARVLRLIPFFNSLRMMLQSLIRSIADLCAALGVFMLIFFVFGMFFTSGVAAHLQKEENWNDPEYENLKDFFGTLEKSFVSLWMGISGGQDWGEYYTALGETFWMNSTLYLLFIWLSMIAVLNIVTGIFVENAIEQSTKDRDIVIQQELEEKEGHEKAMRQLFQEMANEHSEIPKDVFLEQLEDPRAVAYFYSMDIDIDEAKDFFDILDVDDSNSVDVEEFLRGCDKLKGDAKAIDLATLHHNMRYLLRLIEPLRARLNIELDRTQDMELHF